MKHLHSRSGLAVMALAMAIPAALTAQEAGSRPGPFGFHQGMTVAEVTRMGATPEASDPGWYKIMTAPLSSPDFEYYELAVSPTTGLCRVLATGVTVRSSGDGQELRSTFDRLEDALKTRYGATSNEFDFLVSESIWSGPGEFMMGLYEKDRHLASFWGLDGHKIAGNPELIAIGETAYALNGQEGWVAVKYEFKNEPSCSKEIEAKRTSAM